MRVVSFLFCLVLANLALASDNHLISQQALFIEKLKPKILNVNKQILLDRQKVLRDRQSLKTVKHLPYEDYEQLFKLGDYYKVTTCEPAHWSKNTCIKSLLNRIDVLPTDLILAQAINESDWGQSRFAKEGNNYFGIWCFRKGCGIVPSARPKGETYEVRRFVNVQAGIAAYYQIINTHSPYLALRNARAKMREQGKYLNAYELATGLEGYSTRRQAYVKSIQGIIRHLQAKNR
jgi:Bax protein